MGRPVWMLLCIVAMASGAVVLAPVAATADADEMLARWEMNEGPNASVMVDSSGNGIDGAIGAAVETSARYGGATGYRWSFTTPNVPPAQPERLVIIDDERLNPGLEDYAITVRFRTTRSFGNIIQKGQSGAVGGMWKWQIPDGQLTCLFRGVDEQGRELQGSVNSGNPQQGFARLNDGEWHVVRCERTATQVRMTIDPGTPDQRVRTADSPTGSIANDWPLSIAGKSSCNQMSVTCDYFVGDIDYVHIETGSRNEAPAAVAGGDCEYLQCDFSAGGSSDPDGTIVGYAWDFGDGTTASGSTPSHAYAQPGTYVATLTVTDDDGDTDTDTVAVVAVSAPPDPVAAGSCTGRSCDFSAVGSSDPDGSIVSYDWDFGDGATGTGLDVTHGYASPGIYTVTLTVTDNHGVSAGTSIDVAAENLTPTASISVVCDVLTCAFDGSASTDADGTIVSYEWDFGDGATGLGSNTQHTYAGAADYQVTLTVIDDEGGVGTTNRTLSPTAPPAVHIHNLRSTSYDAAGDKWVARIVVKLRDAAGARPQGVEVTVTMGTKTRSCVTNTNGNCNVKRKVRDTKLKVPVRVIEVDWIGGYDPSANKDKDRDGDGETVKVFRPI